MGRHAWWLWGVVLTSSLAPAQVYRSGLKAQYATVNPDDGSLAHLVGRIDPYPWFYQTPWDFEVGEFRLRTRSEYPWPDEVRQRVDLRSMLAMWNGFLFVPKSGRYRFQVLADDLALLLIDDQEVVKHYNGFFTRTRRGYQGNPPTVGELSLAPGMHRLSLLYGNTGAISGIFFRWQRPGEEQFSAIPGESLLHDPNADSQLKAPAELRHGPRLIGSGSGFVVHPDGWLLSCHHVVSGPGFVSVKLGDEEVQAEVVVTDARHDLALLKIDRQGLAAVRLADIKAVKRQDEVLCFGYPLADVLGFDLSVENGRITAIRNADGARALQTNAPIKPGNSGGPMVSLRGEVVGVVNARLEIDGATEGVAFAVPIDYAAPLLGRIPEFSPSYGTAEAVLSPAEVDELLSAAVLPILVREEQLRPAAGRPRAPASRGR
ncbi:MAG: trypsin-like peptidase domain-containing protein [Armatimonadetes bacterium]|nr:trypsin-like peptidase domain-containing protein [Armatimonadota bacterium]